MHIGFIVVRPHDDVLFVKLWCQKFPTALAHVGGVQPTENTSTQVNKVINFLGE